MSKRIMHRSISVILPAYNEEFGIQTTLLSIPQEALKKAGYTVEILVVDNNSTDGTAAAARKLGARVVREKRQGYGYAYKAGFAAAKGTLLIACDGDGTYPVQTIPELLAFFGEKHLDFLTTNRFGTDGKYLSLKTMPLLNRFGNMLLTFLCQALYNLDLKDSQSGMWIMKRTLLDHMHIRANQMNFSQEIKIEALYYLKCSWGQLPIIYADRVGTRKLNIIKHGLGNFFFLFYKRYHR